MEEKIQIDAGVIIDMNQEDFEKFILENTISLGNVCNLNFYFRSLYQQTLLAKNDLVNKIASGEIEDSEEVRNNLTNLYLLMADIEEKVTFLTARIQELM